MDKAHSLAILRRLTSEAGVVETAIEGLRLFKATAPTAPTPGIYPRSVCIILQGRKQAIVDQSLYTYDSQHYLCCSVPIPIQAAVLDASESEPLLGVLLDTDTPQMRESTLRMEATELLAPSNESESFGLAVASWTPKFSEALARLLDLLDTPALIPVLAHGRLRELMVSILLGEAGPQMRQSHGASLEIGRAIAHLRENPSQEISIEELASRCGLSRAAFHRKFKATTGSSPLQFIKALRLNEAAMMLSIGHNAGQAASKVGYASASQFSREFRRHFGKSPREWAAQSRSSQDETR